MAMAAPWLRLEIIMRQFSQRGRAVTSHSTRRSEIGRLVHDEAVYDRRRDEVSLDEVERILI